MNNRDWEIKGPSNWCYIGSSPFLSKLLYVDHLFGIRWLVHGSYIFIYVAVSLIVLFVKSDLDKFLDENYESLSQLAQYIENNRWWTGLIVVMFTWFFILRHCERMYFFSSGKIIRMVIWLTISAVAYCVCGIYLLPLLLLPLPFTYQELLKPSSSPHINRRLRIDLEQILCGNTHNLSDWDKIVKATDYHPWDTRSVVQLLGDYKQLTQEVKKNEEIDGCKKLLCALYSNKSIDPWTKRNIEILNKIAGAIGYVPFRSSLCKMLE